MEAGELRVFLLHLLTPASSEIFLILWTVQKYFIYCLKSCIY